MERCDVSDRHVQQDMIKTRRLLVIPLDGLGRQFLICVLLEELIEKHREGFWQRVIDAGTELC
jgi:hypothetical protein